MNLLDLIKKRRSVRSFKSKEIPDKDLKKILEAARWAPSAGNKQPLEIVVIKSEKKRTQLTKAALNQKFLKEPPVDLVICANISRTKKKYGERGAKLYAIQDTAAATQNIHLMAKSLGYGTCWVGAFHEKRVAEVINAPSEIKPVAIIPIGIPDEDPQAPGRRDLEKMIYKDSYQNSYEME
ncbi:MAG: nitroreductase family protein [Candidatus Hadarchaeota archaeon]